MKKLINVGVYLIGLGFLFAIFLGIYSFYLYLNLPKINSLADYSPPVPSTIYSKDGEVLLELAREKRKIVAFEDIPERIVGAFLSAEDDNFYSHEGVDYIGIMRAMMANIRAGRVVQGGSTITQQVAKSLLLTREKTFDRKIKDLLLALKIEKRFSKEEILFLYLNQVYLGGGYYGVKKAFEGYFDKELEDASIAEAALVAGLLVAPGRYSPYINPRYAKIRQGYVLKRMYVTGKITEQEYEQALEEEIRMRVNRSTPMQAKYFTDWIRQRVIKMVGPENFLTQGYEVYTTLDMKMQLAAEESVRKRVEELDKRQGFKGPVEQLDDLGIVIEEERFRKKIYEDESSFFTFMPDGTNIAEYEFHEEELVEIKRDQYEKIQALPGWFTSSAKYYAGISSNDPLVEFLEKDRRYKGVVVGVNDNKRIIYVSLGGTVGVIPQRGFAWAHRRELSSENQYFRPIQRPSQIVSRGDTIHIKIKGKSTDVWRHIHGEYRSKIRNESIIESLKSERYLLLDLDQEPEAEAAVVALNPHSGELLTMVGGYDFDKSQFNRAIDAKRQPGSAFKPILYGAGLENGFTAASILMDSPESLDSGENLANWKPKNYDGDFKGPMTFRESLELSRNVPTIKLTMNVGVNKVIDFMKRLSIRAQVPSDLSISLGSFGITLMELVRAYGVFPNSGKLVNVKSILSIKDRYGVEFNLDKEDENPGSALEQDEVEIDEDVIDLAELVNQNEEDELLDEQVDDQLRVENPFTAHLDAEQVYDRRLAYIMTQLLRGVIQNGTGKGAKYISSFIGGKTGTTNNYVDAWFIGFSTNVVSGVWVGFDNNTTLGWPETGAKAALPIWKDYMGVALRKYGEHDFAVPEGILNVKIDKKTGRLYKYNRGEPFVESFVVGTEPGAQKIPVVDRSDESDDSGKEFVEDSAILGEEDFFSIQ